MKTQFVNTFKTNLPLSDYLIDIPDIYDLLQDIKRFPGRTLYFSVREHGFEFQTIYLSLMARLAAFHDVIATYTVVWCDGYYELRQI